MNTEKLFQWSKVQDEDTDTERDLVSETTVLKHNKLKAERRAERLPLLNLKYKMEI